MTGHPTVIRMVKMRVVLTVVLVVTRLMNMSRVLNTPVALDNVSCTHGFVTRMKTVMMVKMNSRLCVVRREIVPRHVRSVKACSRVRMGPGV